MKAKEIMTLEHALFWGRQPDTRRRVELKQARDWNDSPLEIQIWVYDAGTSQGAYLPIPFKLDITKFLCEKEQNELMATIENSKRRLETSIKNCEGMV